MEWYYVENNSQAGPVSEEEFKGLVASGKITAQTLIWHEGMQDWTAYGGESEKKAPAAPVVMAVVAGGGINRLEEGGALPDVVMYGGFWIRFAAKFIDGIILGVVNTVLSLVGGATMIGATASQSGDTATFATQTILILLQLTVAVGYTVFFLGKFSATPGKMACKLKVVRSDTSKITYGRACGRYFAEMLSAIILDIGYLMAAFDEEKRTLHDRICDTRVIKTG